MQVPRSDLQTLGDTIIVCTIQCCCPKGEWKCSCLLVSTATAYSPAPYNVVYSRPVRSSHIKGTELSLQIKCCKPSSALYSLPSFLFTSSKYLNTFSLAHSQFYFIDNKTQPIYTRHHETYRNFYQRVPSPSRVDTRRSSLLATPQNIHLQGKVYLEIHLVYLSFLDFCLLGKFERSSSANI
jgi:hypothetical protein